MVKIYLVISITCSFLSFTCYFLYNWLFLSVIPTSQTFGLSGFFQKRAVVCLAVRKFLYPSCILASCFYFLSMSVYSLTGSSAWQQTISLVMQKGNIKFTQLNLHIYTIKWREKKRQIRSFTGSCRISTCVSRMLWSAPVHSTTKPIFSFFHFVCKWILRGTSRADE